ncbi:hypothetical protein VCB98_11405 [Gammaproteobacteria bacterium AB-CW1]|uniref:Uncharacterized protein n=1 Tax=Natronospira elongata TaxID=3110268 RepID=A0AAP6MNC3_9GAMM|nr:hypothetical protein [Gammaproteobacteria bacterium AB-CW1]
MTTIDCPEDLHSLIGRFLADNSRYLELSKNGPRFQLRALIHNQWKVVSIESDEANRIWQWATGRITTRINSIGQQTPSKLPAVMNIVTRFGKEKSRNQDISRLRLRWRARPMEREQNSGTLTMQITELAA